jgi:hypothetical protein
MKTILFLGLCFGIVRACAAQQVLAQYDWAKLAQSGQLLGGTPATVDGRTVLKVVNTNDTPLQTQLVIVRQPAITKTLYAITGEVKYDGVRGDGYLEMWNYYPPAQTGAVEAGYFSRTLGESGDMGKITGTSNWRRFLLPFDRTGTSARPTRLEINLFLPAQGTVNLGSIKLVEYAAGFGSGGAGPANAWWADRSAGLIGGIGGGFIGCLGTLLAWLASKGKARGFVLAIQKGLIVLGGLLVAAGLAALGLRQPYAVWFVLLLVGVLLLGIFPFRLRQSQRTYNDLELRKMTALDA